jgi:hypothetical protein
MSAPQVTPDVRSTSPNAHLTSLYATLTASLAPGETLLWWGQPDPKRIVTRSFDAGLMVYCAVIAVGLSALIAYAAAQNPDKLSSPGFWAGATLTLALPLYGLVGRLLVRRWVRRRTLYGVTPARVITVSAALGTPAATSAWHAAIPRISSWNASAAAPRQAPCTAATTVARAALRSVSRRDAVDTSRASSRMSCGSPTRGLMTRHCPHVQRTGKPQTGAGTAVSTSSRYSS